MKKINIHQSFRYTFIFLLTVLFLDITPSCSDDDNSTSHKVVDNTWQLMQISTFKK